MATYLSQSLWPLYVNSLEQITQPTESITDMWPNGKALDYDLGSIKRFQVRPLACSNENFFLPGFLSCSEDMNLCQLSSLEKGIFDCSICKLLDSASPSASIFTTAAAIDAILAEFLTRTYDGHTRRHGSHFAT